jgi:hypothetical protein
MTAIPDFVDTQSVCPDDAAALLPVDPFNALRIHFGMLLGVDDFETEQAYHRGKMRLHNAWLHGHGVVWGLGVSSDLPSGEIRVERGLALDAAGHELHLDAQACVSAGAWFDAHRNDPGMTVTESADGSTVTFDAHVVMSFRACQTRQVPALSDPCDGSSTSTAYSRVFETVEMHLVPGLDPDPGAAPAPRPYHRLRLLFGLDAAITGSADDIAIVAERAGIETLAVGEQPTAYLAAMRRYAARDSADLQPLTEVDTGNVLLFPAADNTPVVIASVTGITLTKQANAGWQLTAATVSIDMRRTVIDTGTIQELLSGPALVTPAAGPAPAGPKALPDSVTMKGRTITISFADSDPLNPNSVTKLGFKVTVLGPTGWPPIAVDNAVVDATNTTVTLTLHATPAGDVLRLVVFGTGPNPILGQAPGNLPLGGGVDFVHMIALSGGS